MKQSISLHASSKSPDVVCRFHKLVIWTIHIFRWITEHHHIRHIYFMISMVWEVDIYLIFTNKGRGLFYYCVVENEMTAFKSARHSVGRLRNVSMKRSLMGSTVATPTSLHFPSPSILSPLPSLIFPFDSSDVNTVSTSSGRALYRLPTEKQNSAMNLRSTYTPSCSMRINSIQCVWVGQAVNRLMPEAKGLVFKSSIARPLNLNQFIYINKMHHEHSYFIFRDEAGLPCRILGRFLHGRPAGVCLFWGMAGAGALGRWLWR